MKFTIGFLFLLAVLTCASSALAWGMDGYLTIYPIAPEDTQFSSYGRATCFNDLLQPDSRCTLSGKHKVVGPYTFEHEVTGSGTYSHELNGPAELGACYDAYLNVVADPPGVFNDIERAWIALDRCRNYSSSGGGDEAPQCGGGGPYEDCSPIVINFEGRYDLTGSDAPVSFDIKGTGVPALIGWTAAESDEAFLWLDRNGNGIVDGGRELFGTATRLHDGQLAANGFEALRELDSNGDSFVDAGDAAWSQLKLWRDANHNGASETNEIFAVDGSRVARFDLDYRWEGRRDEHGNRFKYESRVWLMGATDLATSRPVYDLFFVGVTN